MRERLWVAPEVAAALARGGAIVALETTVLAHGLPWPQNIDTVRAMSAAVRAAGALPALVGIVGGRIVIGMDDDTANRFAVAARQGQVVEKASRRDVAALLAAGSDGATTVSATMLCASMAGISVFATGGIGGVHRGAEESFDISADLAELSRTPVAVVSAGAKSILDLPRTLEALESAGVPVLGLRTDEFPAFYARSSGLPVSARVQSPAEAAAIARLHLARGEGGLLLACPVPAAQAISAHELEGWIGEALAAAETGGVTGKAVTPFLLDRLATLSAGRTLAANRALLVNNAAIAAAMALAMAE